MLSGGQAAGHLLVIRPECQVVGAESSPHRQLGAVAAPSVSFSAVGAEIGCILIIHSLILLVTRSGPGMGELGCLIPIELH